MCPPSLAVAGVRNCVFTSQVSVVKVGSFNTVWKSVGQHARKKGGVYLPVYGTSYLTVCTGTALYVDPHPCHPVCFVS
jgi:hypothetical protein